MSTPYRDEIRELAITVGHGLSAYIAVHDKVFQNASTLKSVLKAFGVLLMVFAAFTLKNVDEANRRTESHEAETTTLLTVLARPRDPALSAGARGDQLNLAVWAKELAEQATRSVRPRSLPTSSIITSKHRWKRRFRVGASNAAPSSSRKVGLRCRADTPEDMLPRGASDCDVSLSIGPDLPRFTVIDRGDAITVKRLASQQ